MKSDFVAACFFHGCRTGNQLFQIAAAYGHALRHGLECRVPWRFNSDTLALRRWLGEEAACVTDGGYGAPWVYEEPCFSYRNIPKTVRGGALSGYFQSERYFTGFDEEVRFLFRRLTAPVRPGRAGIHVRMGDYLQHTDLYHVPDVPFLHEALSRLSPGIKEVVIFSDSPAQALRLVTSVPEAARFHLSLDNHGAFEALRELSTCQELVLSCSSFSWWGAYLGDQKKVFIQKRWFAGKIKDDQDVFRPHWVRL